MTEGSVVSFDDSAGYGTITTDDGRELFFHCTALTDGTRTVEPGTRVSLEVVPGHLGRYEARFVRSPAFPVR